jgi:hypothetical protein
MMSILRPLTAVIDTITVFMFWFVVFSPLTAVVVWIVLEILNCWTWSNLRLGP